MTPNQQLAIETLTLHGPVYIGSNMPNLIRTYDSLVNMGLVEVVDISDYGKKYKVKK